jgi:hypothetical protein
MRKEGTVGMTRECAVKGLLEVADWHYGKYEQTHEEDYLNDGDFLTAVANLLKAQEPMVMTLGDLRDIGSVWELDTPPYLWMEINPSYRWTRGFWVAWREIYDMIDGLHPTYDADNYGKTWRCWTSRPTAEQRGKEPWNG